MKNKITSLLLAGLLAFMGPTICQASSGVLVDCEKSPGFTKRLNASVKKLETRLKKYEPGTPPALALQSQIDQTKLRFDRYGKSNLLCGTDGLPHLIVDGRLDHAGEFMLPGVMFLYTTGWIGWAGRSYLQYAKKTDKPNESEIIIDVPVALGMMASGFLWPLSAWNELVTGELLVAGDEVTVSPR